MGGLRTKAMTSDHFIFSLAIFLSFTVLAECQFGRPPTKPPPVSNPRPTVIEGVVFNLEHLVPPHCVEPYVTTYPYGGVVKSKVALMRADNPHKIQGNIEIAPTGCMYIEPGSKLYFAPGKGFIVNGTLIARGSYESGGRILFTKDPDSGVTWNNIWPEGARLVDGNTTQDGRLELFYRNKWRGVCTNYVNFTELDANVTCRHLGFFWGNFTYHSFAHNETNYMIFQTPKCDGTENSLFKCPGYSATTLKIGKHVCDGQQAIGFSCEGLREDLALDHWRGFEFYNSTVGIEREPNINYEVNETYSWIEYADILYAGLDTYRGHAMIKRFPRAAISASPHVPLMNNITVMYSAYDGLNLTELLGRVHIANSTISNNRGHGIFIQSSVGRILINHTYITENNGDGIKFYLSNRTIPNFEREFDSTPSFCRSAILASMTYPVLVHGNLVDIHGNYPKFGYCSQRFRPNVGKAITIHTLLTERDQVASGSIEIREQSENGPLLRKYDLQNGSIPGSITGKTGVVLWVLFKYKIPWSKCPVYQPCIRFLMEVTQYDGPDEDFRLFESNVTHNLGYGVNIQDMRSKVFINVSTIAYNLYGAGLRIFQGAGEVILNHSYIEGNADCGVNMTYAGGYQLFNRSHIVGNKGYGVITEYIRLNKTRFEDENKFKLEIVESEFHLNQWTALRIGNYCHGGLFFVNESVFTNNFHETIEYLSCNITTDKVSNFSLAFNKFKSNTRHAVLVSPLLNTVGIITNNSFINHSLAALRIDNGYDLLINRWYSNFKVNFNMFENDFKENMGRYAVYLRLTQNSPNQVLYFKFNRLLDNEITDSFPYINTRSRANAVGIISSGNIVFQRNLIENPQSVRQLSTHLVDPSVIIDGRLNYWGTIDHGEIYDKIFDQDDRFNLAVINYHPALRANEPYLNYTTSDMPPHREQFNDGYVIGGRLETRRFETEPHTTYHVDKDIFVMPTSELIIREGTTLLFESSVGMIVHGRLKADGRNEHSKVTFTLKNSTDLPVANRTTTVRLMDGFNEYEGRLEVEIDGEWGTVCSEGWTELNSALVCQQLGLTFVPDYGEARTKTYGPFSNPVLLSWVTCNEVDMDITQCQAERFDEQSCVHAQDVFIRCQPPTWSGVTLPAVPKGHLPDETQIRHVIIESAGLLDPEAMTFTPALRVDYNFYAITHLTIRNCISDGINVKYNFPYEEPRFENCDISNNLGNGFKTQNPFISVYYTFMKNNDKAGFVYDPFFTEYDALLVRNSIHPDIYLSLTDTSVYNLGDEKMVYFLSRAGVQEQRTYLTEINVSFGFRITLQLLDYNPLISTEKVTIYDSDRSSIASDTRKWEIEEDLVDFPIVSTTTVLTIKLEVKGIRSGRLSFAAISRGKNQNLPIARTHLRNCTMNNNTQGIVTKHYNHPSNEKLELFHRHKEEYFHFSLVTVINNKKEAMHIPSVTKYNEYFVPTYEDLTKPQRLARITYTIADSIFKFNNHGIFGEHNHVDFSNNVWRWEITTSDISVNENGGFEIELPRVNDMLDRRTHSVIFNNTKLLYNKNFAFTIAGYYADVNVQRNNFISNVCKKGLISISGTEKNLTFTNNYIVQNNGKYMFDLDISSHSEYVTSVSGVFEYNDIRNNFYSLKHTIPEGSMPSSYSIAFHGLQSISSKKNLLQNQFPYELVAAITSLSLDTTLMATESWWGTGDQRLIQEKIFDFDDWNNYAIVKYFPHLTENSFTAPVSEGEEIKLPLNLGHLGGRVEETLSLPYRSKAYIVETDLTIMPNAKLVIPPGLTLQFRPNIGILVLGKLEARGLPYKRISFEPLDPENDEPAKSFVSPKRFPDPNDSNSKRKKRTLATEKLRLRGGLEENEGFLELYNASSSSWNIMCDSQFNEKAAEVVCRELGLEVINVKVRFTHLYDFYVYGEPMYFLKEFWYYTYYCRGDEDSLDSCMMRVNYNLLPCVYAANYTFIRCGKRNLPDKFKYWGNIRFAPSTYEESLRNYDLQFKSILEYIDIKGAGMLHGEKVGAIQTTYVTPIMSFINITKCASNGFDFIAPRDELEIKNQEIHNNLGYAINVLVLNGDSKSTRRTTYSSFEPLVASTIPYYLFGLVEMCRMEKLITVEHRLILYYKYTHKVINCVKIIQAKNPAKRIAFRFLQLNLFHDYFYRNAVEIFDGQTVSEVTRIGEITANSSLDDRMRVYQSSGDTLAVHIHASVSHWTYGFIAEIVTVPLSGQTFPDNRYSHLVKSAVITQNEDGAILYNNIGEINPTIIVELCQIENNGVAILNLTSPPIIDISLYNTEKILIQNNFVARNKGGVFLQTDTFSIATALTGNISHNVFAYGTNGETLNITGHHFQKVYVQDNFIVNNSAGNDTNNLHFNDVAVDFSFNVVQYNLGHNNLATYAKELTQTTQLINRNGFLDNNSTALYRSTLRVGSGKPDIVNNYILNPLSDFELETCNKTDQKNYLTSNEKPINITKNWWGSVFDSYINGRIWDNRDDPRLVVADYSNYKVTNSSVVEGKCAPGWVLDSDRCYRYIGAALPYSQAEKFCKESDGFLAEFKGKQKLIKYLVQLSLGLNYNPDQRIWVYSEVSLGRCSAFQESYIVEEENCRRLLYPFICEKDPYLAPPSDSIIALAIGISGGVFGFLLLLIIIITICACVKSKRRKNERFERRSSIRNSNRSRSTITGLSDATPKRSLATLDSDRHFVNLSGVTLEDTDTDYNTHRYNSSGNDFTAGKRPEYNPHPGYRGRGNDNVAYSEDDGYSEEYDDSEFDDDDDESDLEKRKPTESIPPTRQNGHVPSGMPLEELKVTVNNLNRYRDNMGYNSNYDNPRTNRPISLSSFSPPESPADKTPIKEQPPTPPPPLPLDRIPKSARSPGRRNIQNHMSSQESVNSQRSKDSRRNLFSAKGYDTVSEKSDSHQSVLSDNSHKSNLKTAHNQVPTDSYKSDFVNYGYSGSDSNLNSQPPQTFNPSALSQQHTTNPANSMTYNTGVMTPPTVQMYPSDKQQINYYTQDSPQYVYQQAPYHPQHGVSSPLSSQASNSSHATYSSQHTDNSVDYIKKPKPVPRNKPLPPPRYTDIDAPPAYTPVSDDRYYQDYSRQPPSHGNYLESDLSQDKPQSFVPFGGMRSSNDLNSLPSHHSAISDTNYVDAPMVPNHHYLPLMNHGVPPHRTMTPPPRYTVSGSEQTSRSSTPSKKQPIETEL